MILTDKFITGMSDQTVRKKYTQQLVVSTDCAINKLRKYTHNKTEKIWNCNMKVAWHRFQKRQYWLQRSLCKRRCCNEKKRAGYFTI